MSGQRQKWKQAASSGTQIVNTAKTAKTATFNKSHISDLRVSLIQGTNFSSTTEGVEGKNYNSSKYSALTVSAEMIRFQGGGKLKEYKDANNNTLEQFIQPLSFYNNFTDSGDGQPNGVIAHASQRNKNNIQDPTVKINAFGMFGAPNENLVLTVSDSSGGIYDYIKGDSSSQIATGKTAVVVDPSNRVFMGINGQDLTQDKLNYLVSGSKNAQLYVKGDIVVDGSGVQIDKYLVDDIFIGESAAIMGNGLGGKDYPFFNDINNSVPDLKTELEDKESANNKKGYLFVANNSSFYGDVGISGGVTLGDGLTLDNSGYWINGHSTLNISAPSYGTHASIGGINYKSIKANIYDYSYNNNGSPELISTFQHARYDGQDSALLLQHTNPKTSQGSLIFLRSRGPSGETLHSTDVTGQIQFRGYDASNGQYGTGKLTSTSDKSITLYGNAVCRLATDVSGGGKNRIDFLTDPSGNNAAIAMIHSDVSNNVYNYILDAQSNAIPTVDYVKSKLLWDLVENNATSAAITGNINVGGWIQPKNPTPEDNVYIPGKVVIDDTLIAGDISGNVEASSISVTDTFTKTCHGEDILWGLFDNKSCDTENISETVIFNVIATSNFDKTIRALHSPATGDSYTGTNVFAYPYSMYQYPGIVINPSNPNNDAVISLVGNRCKNNSSLFPSQILFGDHYSDPSGSDPSGVSFLGGIRTYITDASHSTGNIINAPDGTFWLDDSSNPVTGTYSIGNVEFCGSNDGKELVPFMTYEASSNPSTKIERTAGSGPVLMINDFTDIPAEDFHNTGQESIAKLSIQRSNGATPSTNKTGIIGEINFNGYANGGTNIGMHRAASIQCWNAGDSKTLQDQQGQNGFLRIDVYDNSGASGSGSATLGENPAIQIDTRNHVYINAIPAGLTKYTSSSIQPKCKVSMSDPWDGASFNGFPSFADVSDHVWRSLKPGFSVFRFPNDDYIADGSSVINNGLVAAAGGYLTGTYIQEDAENYYMTDVSYVKNHVSKNGSNWEESNSTTIQPKSPYTQVQATTFNATSDEAKKENIQTISGALESINELRGVTYNLKIDESKKTHHGVVAQEIDKIFPDMVSGEEGNKSVAYMEIIGVLIEAVKDLKKRVEQLENK